MLKQIQHSQIFFFFKGGWWRRGNIRKSIFCTKNIFSHLSAYRSVFNVCSHADCPGDTLAIMQVRELPTKASFKMWVSLLCRNGVWRLSWSMDRMHSLSCMNKIQQWTGIKHVAEWLMLKSHNWNYSAWNRSCRYDGISVPTLSLQTLFCCSKLCNFCVAKALS